MAQHSAIETFTVLFHQHSISFQDIWPPQKEICNPLTVTLHSPPTPVPWHPLICFLSWCVYLFWVFPINEIIHYVAFVAGFIHSAYCLWGSSMLQRVSVLPASVCLKDIPSYGYSPFCLSIHLGSILHFKKDVAFLHQVCWWQREEDRETERQRRNTGWSRCLEGQLPSQGAGAHVSLLPLGEGLWEKPQPWALVAPQRRLGRGEWVGLEEREGHSEKSIGKWPEIECPAGVRECDSADAGQCCVLVGSHTSYTTQQQQ